MVKLANSSLVNVKIHICIKKTQFEKIINLTNITSRLRSSKKSLTVSPENTPKREDKARVKLILFMGFAADRSWHNHPSVSKVDGLTFYVTWLLSHISCDKRKASNVHTKVKEGVEEKKISHHISQDARTLVETCFEWLQSLQYAYLQTQLTSSTNYKASEHIGLLSRRNQSITNFKTLGALNACNWFHTGLITY